MDKQSDDLQKIWNSENAMAVLPKLRWRKEEVQGKG